MFVFIAHAEADQAAADDLKAFLKTRGLIAETETGAKGFRHLGHTDIAIVLWSQKSPFATHRMQIERRMLDAWADQQLVLVKLDHGFLPIGVRDLPAIDASFEQSRQLTAWPQVVEAARAAIKRLQVATSRVEGVGSAWHEEGGLRERMRDLEAMDKAGRAEFRVTPPMTAAPGAAPSEAAKKYSAQRTASPARKARFPWITLLLIAILGVGAAGWMLSARAPMVSAPEAGSGTPPVVAADMLSGPMSLPVAFSLGGLLALLLLVIIVRAAGSRGAKAKKSAAKPAASREASAPARMSNRPAAAPAAAPTAQPALPPTQPASALLFVSYAHADDAAVSPIVQMVEGAGRHVWIDKTGIQTGDGWAGEIVRAIKAAKGVIVMCSKHAFESDHIKREVYLADRYKKPMVPLFIEEAAPPEDFEYFFASVQWLELFRLPEADRAAAIGQALKAV